MVSTVHLKLAKDAWSWTLAVSTISTVISLAVESIGYFYSNAAHCIFDDNTAKGTIPIQIYWVLLIDVVNGFGPLLITCSIFELGMAQELVMGAAGVLV